MRNEQSVRQFLGYVSVGIVVLAVDLSTLAIFLGLSVERDLAISFAILCAMVTQFSLNRWLNFRANDAPIWHQATFYVLVTAINMAATVFAVRVLLLLLPVSTMAAKIISLPFTTPPTFFAHKYLTFGPGARRFGEYLSKYRGRT